MPVKASSSLTLIVAQRLLRKSCPHCSTLIEPSKKYSDFFNKNGFKTPSVLQNAVGCKNCYNSGYKGRIGIFEIIQVDRDMEKLIYSGALHSTIEDAAVKGGTDLLIKQALRHVAARRTSMEEIFRVVADA